MMGKVTSEETTATRNSTRIRRGRIFEFRLKFFVSFEDFIFAGVILQFGLLFADIVCYGVPAIVGGCLWS